MTDRTGLGLGQSGAAGRARARCGAAWVGRGSRAAGQLGALGSGGRAAQLVK